MAKYTVKIQNSFGKFKPVNLTTGENEKLTDHPETENMDTDAAEMTQTVKKTVRAPPVHFTCWDNDAPTRNSKIQRMQKRFLRIIRLRIRVDLVGINCRQRPHHAEKTGSRPITEVKQRRARLVLGWVTAWEHRVSLPPNSFAICHYLSYLWCADKVCMYVCIIIIYWEFRR